MPTAVTTRIQNFLTPSHILEMPATRSLRISPIILEHMVTSTGLEELLNTCKAELAKVEDHILGINQQPENPRDSKSASTLMSIR